MQDAPCRTRPSTLSRLLPAIVLLGSAAVFLAQGPDAASQVAEPAKPAPPGHPDTLFVTSHECAACHNGLTARDGEDISMGVSWRASIMANSARDPYWQAAVRREAMDHPSAAEEIENECSICHMPMSTTRARAEGRHGEIFAHLPIAAGATEEDRLAADGVSCALCHQIGPDRFGTPRSFTGGFVIGGPAVTGERRMFGPFPIDDGRKGIMRSATGMTPAEATHVRESELCATCHTLYTQALGPDGAVVGTLPEQVPYLEWRHSAFRQEQSCQACHMPEVEGPARIASVLGEERTGVSRHTFFGGNFFMLRMLNRYRTELGVEALPQELDAAATGTLEQLRQRTASLALSASRAEGGRLAVDVTVANLTGHKLPTAYPSRRAWLHVTVHDAGNRPIFSSGAIEASGLIRGNDNDADATRFEPHHTVIEREDQVQIYESIMRDAGGDVTTGLLRATAYVKDNRLLPRGFDKATADRDIAVLGNAREDEDFSEGGDRVRYLVETGGRAGPFRVDVELRYQPISFRWAQNLREYDAPETRRFVSWFGEMSPGSSAVLARERISVP